MGDSTTKKKMRIFVRSSEKSFYLCKKKNTRVDLELVPGERTSVYEKHIF